MIAEDIQQKLPVKTFIVARMLSNESCDNSWKIVNLKNFVNRLTVKLLLLMGLIRGGILSVSYGFRTHVRILALSLLIE